jgi:hypothetical protein
MLPERAFQPRAGKFGSMTLEGGKGSSSAPSPDPQVGQAQKQLAQLSQDQWDYFTKNVAPQMLTQTQQQQDNANSQTAIANSTQQFNLDQAKQAYANYQAGALPAMQAIKSDADQYNQAGYQEQMAQQALGDVNASYDNAQKQQQMQQQAYGIDPTSGASVANNQSLGAQKALASASAMTQVRNAAAQLGLQKQANVYNMYAGLPAQANANTQIGLAAGNQGFSTGQAALGNYAALGSANNAAATTAMSGWNNVGNLGVGVTNAATNAWGAQQQANATSSAGLGQLFGTGIGAYAALA